MQMNLLSLNDQSAWEAAGVKLPGYDVPGMIKNTRHEPVWIHFGAGNIFRGFIAMLQQRLLREGLAGTGIIAAETFDYEIIDKIYKPYDNLTMNVTLHANSTTEHEIVASIAEAIKANSDDAQETGRLIEIFTHPGLQLASFTITEKGYSLYGANGRLLPMVESDMKNGPDQARNAMGIVTAMLYRRYQAGKYPLAVVSMDNCSHNGEKLRASILTVAEEWAVNQLVDVGFMDYLGNEDTVSFPWSMIDKITPRPAQIVEEILREKGIEGMHPIITGKQTYIAPFVNTERPQYLVLEDSFPNGRPALDRIGVYMTDRDTVNKTERMKVTTCLNPLHTAMAVYGCLLGYTLISKEMQDDDIVRLIRRLGYTEGLPVVTDPGILSPRAFIDEVVNERLPNPFMPDVPQRIATDTSQKVGIRFGETIKSYLSEGRDLETLVSIPLAIAGWMRYLLGVNDKGEPMEVSPDPLKDELQAQLSGVVWNDPASYRGQLVPILSNSAIFGSDLCTTSLSGRIETYFVSQLNGAGAVRATLRKALQKDNGTHEYL